MDQIALKILGLVALTLLAGMFWVLLLKLKATERHVSALTSKAEDDARRIQETENELEEAKHRVSALTAKAESDARRIREADTLLKKFELINHRLKQLEKEKQSLIAINRDLETLAKNRYNKPKVRKPLDSDVTSRMTSDMEKTIWGEIRSIVHAGPVDGAGLDGLEKLASLIQDRERRRVIMDYIIGSVRTRSVSSRLTGVDQLPTLTTQVASELIIEDDFLGSFVRDGFTDSNEYIESGLFASRASTLVIDLSTSAVADARVRCNEGGQSALDEATKWLCEFIDTNKLSKVYMLEGFVDLDLGKWSDLKSIQCLGVPADGRTLEYLNRLLVHGALSSLTHLEIAPSCDVSQEELVKSLLECTQFHRLEEIALGTSREDWARDGSIRADVITLDSMHAVLKNSDHLAPLFEGTQLRQLSTASQEQNKRVTFNLSFNITRT